MTEDEKAALTKFIQTSVNRINNLNERVVFLEETITKLINLLGKSDIKSPHEADNDRT